MLKGIGASQGYGIGNAVVINDASLDYNHIKYTSADEEKERLQKAVDSFIKETRQLVQDVKKSAGDKEAEILAKKYPDIDIIQAQLITIYLKQKNYEEIENI